MFVGIGIIPITARSETWTVAKISADIYDLPASAVEMINGFPQSSDHKFFVYGLAFYSTQGHGTITITPIGQSPITYNFPEDFHSIQIPYGQSINRRIVFTPGDSGYYFFFHGTCLFLNIS